MIWYLYQILYCYITSTNHQHSAFFFIKSSVSFLILLCYTSYRKSGTLGPWDRDHETLGPIAETQGPIKWVPGSQGPINESQGLSVQWMGRPRVPGSHGSNHGSQGPNSRKKWPERLKIPRLWENFTIYEFNLITAHSLLSLKNKIMMKVNKKYNLKNILMIYQQH